MLGQQLLLFATLPELMLVVRAAAGALMHSPECMACITARVYSRGMRLPSPNLGSKGGGAERHRVHSAAGAATWHQMAGQPCGSAAGGIPSSYLM